MFPCWKVILLTQWHDLPAGLPKGSPVEVTYRYDSAGRIHVSARELVGNTEAATEIVRENLGGTEENLNVMTGIAQQYEVE
jgi:molecular chaperone DnaK